MPDPMVPEDTARPGAAPRIDRVLVLEDSDTDFRLLQRHLQRQGIGAQCLQVRGGADLRAALQTTDWQVVLADHQLAGVDFDTELALLRQCLPEVPVVLVSGTIGEELAVDLLHRGVADFVLKDRLARLVPAIERCVNDVQLRREAARAAEALAESEAFSRAVLASMDDALFIAQERRFVFFNPAMPALLGYDEAGFRGLPFESVVAPESLALWDERYRRRVAGEVPEPERRYEVVFLHRDGHRIWFELRAARFAYHGEPAVLGLLRDVTDRRRIVAELQQHRDHLEVLVEERTQRAEAANRSKSAFLATMSHEIRTPMNAITGSVYLLLREATSPPMQARLTTIDKAARHLLRLLNDVLDLSKIESGKLDLEQVEFDLHDLVMRSCDMVRDRAQQKGLLLQVDGVPQGIALRGDPTRIAQVLLNLLGNAVKFTERGGVRLRCAVQAEGAGLRRLRLEVQDTGIGIAPARIERIFEAFEQADSATTRHFGGTGLGLAIARRLAQRMGGEVGAHSVVGQGSVFWFTALLEAAASAPQAAPDAATDGPHGGVEAALRSEFAGARVLVADDNPVNQALTAELLGLVGLRADTAADGHAALELLQRTDYALALLDVQMPGMDGLQVCRAVRAMQRQRRLPILAITANAFSEDRAACLAAGMDDHIVKPILPQRLYAVMLQWLRRARSAVPALQAGPAPGAAAAAAVPDLDRIPGLDVDRGLGFFAGQRAAYLRGLARFCTLYRDGLPGVDPAADLAAAAVRQDIRHGLHSLAGAADSIGAAAIARRAHQLHDRLRDGAADPALAPALQGLVEDLRSLVGAVADRTGSLAAPLQTTAPR